MADMHGASPKVTPIIMCAPMVRALLSGTKQQTRRIIKPQPVSPGEGAYFDAYNGGPQWNWWAPGNRQYLSQIIRCPYGRKRDLLYVKETFCPVDDREHGGTQWIDYRATQRYSVVRPAVWENAPDDPESLNWKPSIFMPRYASRLTLELKEVRVERLNDISEEDAKAEGCDHNGPCDHTRQSCEEVGCMGHNSYRGGYADLWESLHGKGSWSLNPFVWVLRFSVHHKNVDALIRERAAP